MLLISLTYAVFRSSLCQVSEVVNARVQMQLCSLLGCIVPRLNTPNLLERQSVLRCVKLASKHSFTWDSLSDDFLQLLIDILLNENKNTSQIELLTDTAAIIQRICVLEKNANTVYKLGGIHSFVQFLNESNPVVILCGLRTLSSLAAASCECCTAIFDQGVEAKIIALLEHNYPSVTLPSLECLHCLLSQQKVVKLNLSKHSCLLSSDVSSDKRFESHDSILSLFRMDNILQGDGTKILYDILLMIADGDNEAFWDVLIRKENIPFSIELLNNKNTHVVSRACEVLYHVTSSNMTLCSHDDFLNSGFPILSRILRPVDKLGSSTSLTPYENAAKLVSNISCRKEALLCLLNEEVLESYCLLILRERRLGRLASVSFPVSNILKHALVFFYNVDAIPSQSNSNSNFWSNVLALQDGIKMFNSIIEILVFSIRKLSMCLENGSGIYTEAFGFACSLIKAVPWQNPNLHQAAFVDIVSPLLETMRSSEASAEYVPFEKVLKPCALAIKACCTLESLKLDFIRKGFVTRIIFQVAHTVETEKLLLLFQLLHSVIHHMTPLEFASLAISDEDLEIFLNCVASFVDLEKNVTLDILNVISNSNKFICLKILSKDELCGFVFSCFKDEISNGSSAKSAIHCVVSMAQFSECREAVISNIINKEFSLTWIYNLSTIEASMTSLSKYISCVDCFIHPPKITKILNQISRYFRWLQQEVLVYFCALVR